MVRTVDLVGEYNLVGEYKMATGSHLVRTVNLEWRIQNGGWQS
jgi:hypothetical protein